MSRIEQIITEIEDYIDSCKFQPLSNTKILVNKEEIEELLVELRLRIPEEIKKYQKIISNQDAILQEARSQADAMVAEATAQTNELVNEHEIMQQKQTALLSRQMHRHSRSWTTLSQRQTISARVPFSTRTTCSAACRPSSSIRWMARRAVSSLT